MNGESAALPQHDVFGAPVRVGAVPTSVARPLIDLPWLQASTCEAVLRIEGVGHFHVAGGRQVSVDPFNHVPPSRLGGWLSGPVAALVLAQRQQFALHASTVRLGGALVAIAGPSGAGKSTTACLLARRGHDLVTDDMTAVDLDSHPDEDHPAGRAGLTVRPSGRRLHLWPAAVARLDLDPDDCDLVSPDSEKRAYAISTSTGTHTLGLIIALRTSPHVTRPVARRLDGTAAVEALLADTYRRILRRLHPEPYLRWIAAIATAVPVVRVDRPTDGWSCDEVAAMIERVAATPQYPQLAATVERRSELPVRLNV